MSLFITGDLHGRAYFSKLERFASEFGHKLSKEDVLLVLGDFCLPWDCPPNEQDNDLMGRISQFPWTTAFIDGNHENHDMLSTLPTARVFDATAGRLAKGIYHLRRGRVYSICGHKMLTMGGAMSQDADILKKSGSWWPEEVPNAKERAACDRAIKKHPQIDIVATHTPPTRQLISHAKSCDMNWEPDEFCDWLQTHVADKVRFRAWFYGHMHDDRPWETPYTPLMHVIYDVDSRFPDQLWGPDSMLDDWYPEEPF